jgi:phosphatidylglycerophosphatase A
MRVPAKILATFFGVGFFPLAPGTLASALVVIVSRVLLSGVSPAILLAAAAVLFFLGVWAAGGYASVLGLPDPGRIVVDEVCGQVLALALVPRRGLPVVLAFVFFRVFDIVKPFPLRKLERLPGGWGIMADDVGAGLAAAAAVHLVLALLRVARVSW